MFFSSVISFIYVEDLQNHHKFTELWFSYFSKSARMV